MLHFKEFYNVKSRSLPPPHVPHLSPASSLKNPKSEDASGQMCGTCLEVKEEI